VDVEGNDEDGVEGGVMSYDRPFTDDIIPDVVSRVDDESERGGEAYASTASIASPTGRFVCPLNVLRCLCSRIVASVGRQLNEASPHGTELDFEYLLTV